MTARYKVVIPARYDATRLPGKLLKDVAGKPLLQHVFESAVNSSAEEVVIATDSKEIKDTALAFGATVVMTSTEHASGTDRIAEAVSTLALNDDTIIVNTQGDEFGLPGKVIDQLADALYENPDKPMATLCEPITDNEDVKNPNVVKVVRDVTGSALYFSRLPIPWRSEHIVQGLPELPLYRHVGIYAYRAGFLQLYTSLEISGLEQCEKLEQLRAMYHGYKIQVVEACMPCGMEINTPEDLEKARMA